MLEQVDGGTVHGWGFILLRCFFPRLTRCCLRQPTASCSFPRLQVAILATLQPTGRSPTTLLVIVTWIWAASAGKSGEEDPWPARAGAEPLRFEILIIRRCPQELGPANRITLNSRAAAGMTTIPASASPRLQSSMTLPPPYRRRNSWITVATVPR